MIKTIPKTFRLPIEIAKEIEVGSQKNNLSQAEYIVAIFSQNKLLKLQKTFLEDAKNMDEAYRKEQQELADADFL